jgi:ORF6N domain
MPKPEELAQLVFFVRGERVIFDTDLAMLYGVRTKALNQALFRNKGRFPEDFAFQLTKELCSCRIPDTIRFNSKNFAR